VAELPLPKPVTLGTAGISAHLTVVLLPAAHGVFAKLRQYRRRRYRPRRVQNMDDERSLQYFRRVREIRSLPALRQ
jgi:pheromone shutdown protein TraB